jgi:predicted RNase H-like HicB family nuclease
MISEYLAAAMRHARYEIIEDEEPFYGEIPETRGVWATGTTLEACREELLSVLESWILIRIAKGMEIPMVDGLGITVGPFADVA